MRPLVCDVEECDLKVFGRIWCEKHYYRWLNHGDVTTIKRVYKYDDDATCAAVDCDRKIHAKELCTAHYYRQKRSGVTAIRKPVQSFTWHGDEPDYAALHARLRAELGPAKDYQCIDCEKPAYQWSYIGGDPDEVLEPQFIGKRGPRRFSRNSEFYRPRCTKCHSAFDRAQRQERTANGAR